MATPKKNPEDPATGIVARFLADYGLAHDEAQRSVVHTATEGWRHLVSAQRKQERDERRKLATDLKALAIRMEDFGLSEDEDKAVGEIKKSSTANRECREAFDRLVIAPVCQPVANCARIITEAKNEARRLEQEMPLQHRWIEDEMGAAIEGVEVPRWDEPSGRVVMTPAQR